MKVAICPRLTVPAGSNPPAVPDVTRHQRTQSMAARCTLPAGTSAKPLGGTLSGGQPSGCGSRLGQRGDGPGVAGVAPVLRPGQPTGLGRGVELVAEDHPGRAPGAGEDDVEQAVGVDVGHEGGALEPGAGALGQAEQPGSRSAAVGEDRPTGRHQEVLAAVTVEVGGGDLAEDDPAPRGAGEARERLPTAVPCEDRPAAAPAVAAVEGPDGDVEAAVAVEVGEGR
jgi:hypothetical protein